MRAKRLRVTGRMLDEVLRGEQLRRRGVVLPGDARVISATWILSQADRATALSGLERLADGEIELVLVSKDWPDLEDTDIWPPPLLAPEGHGV